MSSRAGWIAVAALLAVSASFGQEPLEGRPVADLGIDRTSLPTPVDGVEGVEPLFRDGRVLIAGQPSTEALRRIHELGVTAVVNLRTPAEMEDRERVPYDEAAAVGELGMEYLWIPLGGDDHPYTPEAVERFARVLSQHRGPVLLHCTVAWRASYMWVAYLIRYQGFTLDRALERGQAIAISPSPLAGLLDRRLAVTYADEPP